MRTRREIRDLTEDDREAFLDALQIWYTIPNDAGRANYGDDFENYERTTVYHNAQVRRRVQPFVCCSLIRSTVRTERVTTTEESPILSEARVRSSFSAGKPIAFVLPFSSVELLISPGISCVGKFVYMFFEHGFFTSSS